MITNVRRVKSSGDIQRYVRYTIAPEEEQNNENYIFGERTLAIESDYIDIDLDADRNHSSNEITDQIMHWNAEKRVGKKTPACPAVAGVIAFSTKDTEQFYSTNENGVRYLDRKRAIEIAREAIGDTMGYDRPIYLSLHGDKEHLHVHFVAGLVDSQGKIWDGSTMTNEQGEKVKVRDFRRWEITNEKLEIKYGLERVEHRKAMEHEGEHRKAQVKRPSNAVVHLANKGEIAPSLDLAGRLELAYKNSNKQFDKFLELSEQYGINIKPNMGTTKVNGLSFSIDGMDNFIKASDLGNRYKWTKLEKDLNYEHERDYPKLAELKATASTTARTERPASETTSEIERLTRITDQIAETVRHSVNGTDYGISPSIRNEERVQSEPASGLPQEATGNRTNQSTADSVGASTYGRDPTGFNRVPDSPSPMPSNGVRDVEPEQQGKQPTSIDSTTTDGHDSPEQSNLRGSEEAQVKRRERTITTLMRNGGYTREQAEVFYANEQKIAEKKAEEPTWTPDTKPQITPPKKDVEYGPMMEAFYKQELRKQRSQKHTLSQSSDGYSI